MPVPARLIRRHCDDMPANCPPSCHKEEERRTRIMDSAQLIMAIHGRAAIRMTEFALGLRMSPLTIRRHFPDLDHLLAEILRRHIQTIIRAIGQVPQDAPNRYQARRAAYLSATRTGLGAPTEAHLLLIRDRHLLPPDEAEPIEALRAFIGGILAGDQAEAALALLDTPELTGADIEKALAAIARPHKATAPQPQPLRPHHEPPQPAKSQSATAATLPYPNDAQRPRAGTH